MDYISDDLLKGAATTFFDYLKYLWWPDIDEKRMPPMDRQIELFKRICTGHDNDGFSLRCTLEQFNSLLTECYQPSVTSSFFTYFFPAFADGIRLKDFMSGIYNFIKVALWQWNFEGLKKSDDVYKELEGVPFSSINPVPKEIFTRRLDFKMQELDAKERYVLGYTTDLSGYDEEFISNARKVGAKNTRDYLTMDVIDVYVATSMMELEEFQSFESLLRDIFDHPDLSELKLRYF